MAEVGTVEHYLSLIPTEPDDSSPDALARLNRRIRVAHLYFQGRTWKDIGALVGCDPKTAKADVDWLLAFWLRVLKEPRDRWLAEELARVRALETETWAIYRRSMRPTKKLRRQTTSGRTTKVGAPMPDLIRKEMRKDRRDGELLCIARLESLSKYRMQLLGLLQKADKQGEVTEQIVTVVGGIDVRMVAGLPPAEPTPDPVIDHNPASPRALPESLPDAQTGAAGEGGFGEQKAGSGSDAPPL